MKAFLKSLSLLALVAFVFAPGIVRAQDDSDSGDDDQGVSFQTFYDQLSDQGTWVQTDDYGYVWQPPVTDPDWRPYSEGHWVDSDQGWTWVSDEPWGWATYHYGRWANIDGTGWVWVPGYRWAPAWVSWRYGGGYAGWAPLPPETLYGAEYGDADPTVLQFHFGGDVDVNFGIGAGCYNFIEIGDMGERSYHHRYVDRDRNYTIINHTTNITNIYFNPNDNGGNRHGFSNVNSGGPKLDLVNAHSRQHVQTVHFTASSQPGKSTLQGNSLAIFAPRVNPSTVHQGRPTQVAQTISHPTFNRGDSVTKPLAVTATVRPPPPSPEAVQAAQEAQRNAPAKAHIATVATPRAVSSPKPFTALAPVVQHHPAGTASTEVHPTTKPASAPGFAPQVNHSEPFHTPTPAEPSHPEATQTHSEPFQPQAEQSQQQAAQEEARQQQVQAAAQEAEHQKQAQAEAAARQQQQAQAEAEARQQQQAQAQAEARQQAQMEAESRQQPQVHQQPEAPAFMQPSHQPAPQGGGPSPGANNKKDDKKDKDGPSQNH